MSWFNWPLLQACLVVACLATTASGLPPADLPLTKTLDCSGWPEPRVYFEGQVWWTDPGKNVNSQSVHLHLGTCFPYDQTVSGIVTMDVLVQLHGGQEAFNASQNMEPVQVKAFFSNITDLPESSRVSSSAWTCTPLVGANAAQDCKTVVRVLFDTRMVANGRRVVKINTKFQAARAFKANFPLSIQGPIKVNNPGPGLPITQKPFVVNEVFTGPANDLIVNVIAGAPWSYTFLGFRASDVLLTTPNKPVKGKVQIPGYMQTMPGPRRANFTRGFVSLNPKFHDAPPKLGQVLVDVNNQGKQPKCGRLRVWPKSVLSSCQVNTTLDATKVDAGVQRVFVRGDLDVMPKNPVFGLLPNPPENGWDLPAPGPGTLSIAAVIVVHTAK